VKHLAIKPIVVVVVAVKFLVLAQVIVKHLAIKPISSSSSSSDNSNTRNVIRNSNLHRDSETKTNKQNDSHKYANKYRNLNAIIDSGANVHIASKALSAYAESLGYVVSLSNNTSRIGTAENGSSLNISGWLQLGGSIGQMAVVHEAAYNLISVIL
jgi:hypothetical protein